MVIHSSHNPAYIRRMYASCMFALEFANRHCPKLPEKAKDKGHTSAYAMIQAEAIAFASIG